MKAIFALTFFVITSTLSSSARAQWFVGPKGSDANPGTRSAPFATLGAAQNAMRNSGIKTTVLLAGAYAPVGVDTDCGDAFIELSAPDTGEVWTYDAQDPAGPGSASLDGGSTGPTIGVSHGFCVSGSNGVTIDGLQIHHVRYTAIQVYDPNVSLRNNILHDNTEPRVNGLITAGGLNYQNLSLVHNWIYNAVEHGIRLATSTPGAASGAMIVGNFLQNTCTLVTDCGAIYIQDLLSPSSVGISVKNNYVRDAGGGGARGIYLDDGTSGVTATGNMVVGAGVCFNIHGGSYNNYFGNICDEDSIAGSIILLYQDSTETGPPGPGNAFTNNIITSGQSGNGYLGDTGGTPPYIANNLYHNYVGPTISASGDFSDANPTFADPLLFGWTYTLDNASPAYDSPVNFPPMGQQWGPAGFTINQTGTPPSNPH